MSFPGAVYRRWHTDASKQLLAYKRSGLQNVNRLVLKFFPSTKRAGDLTNKAESVMDCLVDNGFLSDDNWFVCPNIDLRFGGVDRKNPRVEIEYQ